MANATIDTRDNKVIKPPQQQVASHAPPKPAAVSSTSEDYLTKNGWVKNMDGWSWIDPIASDDPPKRTKMGQLKRKDGEMEDLYQTVGPVPKNWRWNTEQAVAVQQARDESKVKS